MKLLFQLEDQVHTFTVTEAVNSEDLSLLKDSLFRFFDSKPGFTVLDLSHAIVRTTQSEFDLTLTKIRTLVTGQGLHLIIALTPDESEQSKNSVLQLALQKQLEVLQAKLELREKMREQAERLVAENSQLKDNVTDQVLKLKSLQKNMGPLNPLLEKLWSEK